MDADRIGRTLTRIAHEILERNRGVEELALVGIRTRGVPSPGASRATLREITSDRHADRRARHHALPRRPDAPRRRAAAGRPPHRDPVLDRRPARSCSSTTCSTPGRTIRAALDALIDFGRPKAIQLIVLVDRGHRELPIKADYVGKNLPTSLEESVQVRLQEIDGDDEVVLGQAGA